MPFVVRAFPVVRPLDELHAFLSTLLNERRAETDKFYGQYSVSHESAYLQEGPHGPQLIVVTILPLAVVNRLLRRQGASLM